MTYLIWNLSLKILNMDLEFTLNIHDLLHTLNFREGLTIAEMEKKENFS